MDKTKLGGWFMFILVLYHIALAGVYGYLYHFGPIFFQRLLESNWFIIVNQTVGFILPLALFLFATKEDAKFIFKPRPLGKTNIVLLAAVSLCMQPVMMLLSAFSSLFFANNIADVTAGMTSMPLPATLLIIAVTPAVCEEIVFRGYILRAYNRLGIFKAALISGLFFAFIHLDPQQFLYTFMMGALLAYLVYYTRSVYAGVLVHFLSNALQVVLVYILPPQESAPAVRAEVLQTVLFLAVASAIFLPVLFILLRVFLSHNRSRNASRDIKTILAADQETFLPPQKHSWPADVSFWLVTAVYAAYIFFMFVKN
ncbi:MAG: CPBP family intramembrane metalloprotease [Defluviitaleaceae bacterium]|nr:CPBP family intramembrane metalloprotease [Defluviitaleaceae bacterium]